MASTKKRTAKKARPRRKRPDGLLDFYIGEHEPYVYGVELAERRTVKALHARMVDEDEGDPARTVDRTLRRRLAEGLGAAYEMLYGEDPWSLRPDILVEKLGGARSRVYRITVKDEVTRKLVDLMAAEADAPRAAFMHAMLRAALEGSWATRRSGQAGKGPGR